VTEHRVPLLSELLPELGGSGRLQLDLKDERMPTTVLDVLARQIEGYADHLIAGGGCAPSLHGLGERLPGLALGFDPLLLFDLRRGEYAGPFAPARVDPAGLAGRSSGCGGLRRPRRSGTCAPPWSRDWPTTGSTRSAGWAGAASRSTPGRSTSSPGQASASGASICCAASPGSGRPRSRPTRRWPGSPSRSSRRSSVGLRSANRSAARAGSLLGACSRSARFDQYACVVKRAIERRWAWSIERRG
jgi:hypothetical protein